MHFLAVVVMISTTILWADCTSPQNPDDYPICIVGAGLSGLTVARELQKKGYRNVLIFEKSHKVGGKLNTYREGDEIQVELGAVIYSSPHTSLLEYVREFQLTSVPVNVLDLVGFDPESAIFRRARFDVREWGRVAMAGLRFLVHNRKYTRDLEYGYEHASPELFVSFSQWLDERNLGSLKYLLSIFLTNMGYGDLEDIPALYALKYLSVDLATFDAQLSVREIFFTVGEGLDTLSNRLASTLNVSLGKEVVRIHRHSDHQEIHFNEIHPLFGTNVIRREKCAKVILAFPPLLTRLSKILDLSEYEKETLKHVKITKYATSVSYIPTLKGSMFFEGFRQKTPQEIPQIMFPAGTGEVILLGRNNSQKTKDMFTTYSWIRGDFNDTMTEFDENRINSQLDAFLQNISKNSKTHFRTTTEYFPHVDSNSLRQGFYKRFSHIQGQGGVYYATTLLTFEVMEQAIKGAKEFVQKYWPDSTTGPDPWEGHSKNNWI